MEEQRNQRTKDTFGLAFRCLCGLGVKVAQARAKWPCRFLRRNLYKKNKQTGMLALPSSCYVRFLYLNYNFFFVLLFFIFVFCFIFLSFFPFFFLSLYNSTFMNLSA